ncbi:MAG: AI-2E family transporter [Candidatus Sumerlaeia bacterium]
MAIDEEKIDKHLKKTALLLGWMLIAAGFLGALYLLWPAIRWFFATISPFLVALVVAYLFNPIVDVAQKKLKLGRVGGIIAVALLVVLILLVFIGFLIPIMYNQTMNVVTAVQNTLPDMLEWFSKWLPEGKLEAIQKDIETRLQNLNIDLGKAAGRAADAAESSAKAVRGAIAGVGAFLSGVAGFFAAGVLVVVIAFYYLSEFHAIPGVIRKLTPPEQEARIMEVLGKVDKAVGGFLRGQLIVCSLIGISAAIGLALIGMKQYAVLVGVIAGVANIIPYLGPVMGATPGILWALVSDSHETWLEKLIYAGLVVLIFAIIQMLDGFVFQPRIVGKNSNLHPLIVMLALLVGAQFGLGGMILAVPLACIGKVLFMELWWKGYLERREEALQKIAKQNE